jgi:hypothetical protein
MRLGWVTFTGAVAKCDILIAARDCQGFGLDIPPTMLALADEVIE